MHQTTVAIATSGPGIYDFTADARRVAEAAGVETGLMTLFVRHTSCSLLIQENADPDVRYDLEAFFRRLVPPSDDPAMAYLHHRSEGNDDMPAHIKSALTAVSLGIPVMRGRLALGTWQAIYLFEHRTRPRRREVVLHVA